MIFEVVFANTQNAKLTLIKEVLRTNILCQKCNLPWLSRSHY